MNQEKSPKKFVILQPVSRKKWQEIVILQSNSF